MENLLFLEALKALQWNISADKLPDNFRAEDIAMEECNILTKNFKNL